jgi:hypothetical protein
VLEQRAHLERIELRPAAWVEESLELFELNCEKARSQHLPGQVHWGGTDECEQERIEKARMVHILHPNAVMARLRAAGVDARTEQHPNARIWLNDWTCHGMVGVNAWVQPQEMDEEGYLLGISQASSQAQKDLLTENFLAARAGRRVRKTLTSLQDPYGPEWSVMRFERTRRRDQREVSGMAHGHAGVDRGRGSHGGRSRPRFRPAHRRGRRLVPAAAQDLAPDPPGESPFDHRYLHSRPDGALCHRGRRPARRGKQHAGRGAGVA